VTNKLISLLHAAVFSFDHFLNPANIHPKTIYLPLCFSSGLLLNITIKCLFAFCFLCLLCYTRSHRLYLITRFSEGMTRRVETVPVLNQTSRHEDIWGNIGTAPRILTSTLDGGEWYLHAPSALSPKSLPVPIE